MPVFYDEAFIRVKSQKLLTIFGKNLNHISLKGFLIHLCSCIYFMHCNFKKVKIKDANTRQRFSMEYTYVKHTSEFDSLQLS